MTLSNSHLAYEPEYDLMTQALDDPGRGVRIPFPDYAAASTYRHRLHYARSIDRRRNQEIYEPGDPLYGTSMFDPLVCRIKQRNGKHYIYIEKNQNAAGVVEAIPENEVEAEEGVPLPKIKPVPQITYDSKLRR